MGQGFGLLTRVPGSLADSLATPRDSKTLENYRQVVDCTHTWYRANCDANEGGGAA